MSDIADMPGGPDDPPTIWWMIRHGHFDWGFYLRYTPGIHLNYYNGWHLGINFCFLCLYWGEFSAATQAKERGGA